MTKRAHPALKSLFCTNSCTLLKIAKIGAPNAKITKRAALGLKTMIIFSKVHEFVQNSIFSSRSARFVIFALGGALFSDFQESARVSTRQLFHPEISIFSHVC